MFKRLDRYDRVAVVPFQKPGTPEAYGLTAQDCEDAAWAVDTDGRRYRGAGAINAALGRVLGLPLLWIYERPLSRPVQDAVYAWVARHRRRLPGVTPYCKTHARSCH
ncbi:MAG: DCC1-like thiol-disulfide oxidoreductase family protein [Planctomycetota bacterium]|nr:DCC1-like thiol-disulfide oxidoreductase family protein [Planctomycetota bacterium]